MTFFLYEIYERRPNCDTAQGTKRKSTIHSLILIVDIERAEIWKITNLYKVR